MVERVLSVRLVLTIETNKATEKHEWEPEGEETTADMLRRAAAEIEGGAP